MNDPEHIANIVTNSNGAVLQLWAQQIVDEKKEKFKLKNSNNSANIKDVIQTKHFPQMNRNNNNTSNSHR